MKPPRRDEAIFPDEIFMDAENIPAFNIAQFEGVIERPVRRRTFYGVLAIFFAVIILFVGRAFELQVLRGGYFRNRSEVNRLKVEVLFADRGVIYDRWGTILASNSLGERVYADLPGLGHVLGYVGKPSKTDLARRDIVSPEMTIGKRGVEQTYGSLLAGTPGTKLIERDSSGAAVSESALEPPTHGGEVTLSIDAGLQAAYYRILSRVAEERGFTGGAGVVMDVRDGELLAIVSAPEFDPEVLSSGEPAEAIARYLSDPKKPFLNRVLAGLYEPGSTIKPLMALAALAEGVITPEKKIYSSGELRLPNPFDPKNPSIFKDWRAHGWVDMRRALAVSSNVYFYEVGGGFEGQEGLGIARIEAYGRRLGFEEETGVDLPGEVTGNVPNPEEKAKLEPANPLWRIGDTYHTAIGQGLFQVTPIRMAVYAAALANGGLLLKPHVFLRSEERPPEPVENYLVRKVDLPEEYFEVVREGMRMGVLEGTAAALNIPGYEIAAKTGTAQVGPVNAKVNSWVIGFFPYREPKYAFATVLEQGRAGNLVGALAATTELVSWMQIYRPEYLK